MRIEISEYLIARISDPWMHDIMVALQELEQKAVYLYRSHGTQLVTAPEAAPTAVAEPIALTAMDEDRVKPDEETFAAMRWASKLADDASVLSLLRALRKEIVEEQVRLYRQRDETAVAARANTTTKITLNDNAPQYHVKMLVAQRFHAYCQQNCISPDKTMPYGAMKTFRQEHIALHGQASRTKS